MTPRVKFSLNPMEKHSILETLQEGIINYRVADEALQFRLKKGYSKNKK